MTLGLSTLGPHRRHPSFSEMHPLFYPPHFVFYVRTYTDYNVYENTSQFIDYITMSGHTLT